MFYFGVIVDVSHDSVFNLFFRFQIAVEIKTCVELFGHFPLTSGFSSSLIILIIKNDVLLFKSPSGRRKARNFFLKKGKRKVQGVPQSQTAPPRHQEEEETDKSKQAQIEQTYE